MLGSKKYISDLVGNDYISWKDTRIIFNAGTGCGKTQFILRVLIPFYLKQNKKILYLCNRLELYKQLKKELKKFKTTNITLKTYQSLQKLIRHTGMSESYDLIVSDECHYFYLDAKFNGYTDLAYSYVMKQQKSVVVFMSATADSFFMDLIADKEVESSHVYTLPKVYDYVEKVYTYEKDALTDILDDILAEDDMEKILVFVNSMQRLVEMHDYYGDSAYYMCSQSQECRFADRDCIQNKKFDKRILFTTKVLDNGVDLMDDDLRHIFSEIFDIDSALQAIGRKRPIDCFDSCCFYFRTYDGRAINNFYVSNEKQLSPVTHYLENKTDFLHFLDTQNIDTRQLARKNKIFYADLNTGKLCINTCTLKKYEMDKRTIERMKESDYETVLFDRLGDDLKSKRTDLEIEVKIKDTFLFFLVEWEGKKLFKEDQKVLKEKFRDILGLHDRTMGINTLNGKLVDCQYNFKIISKQESCRQSEYYKKRYWLIQKI